MFVTIKKVGLVLLSSVIVIIAGCTTKYGMLSEQFDQLTPEQQQLVIESQNKRLDIDKLNPPSEQR